MIQFLLNDTEIRTSLPPAMVLLDFIRYHQHLVGTKIGCREGDCGACTVLVGELKNDRLEYNSMTCCLMPLANAQGKHIVTIEGINLPAEEKEKQTLNPIQQAMADEGATQCGFCTPGFIMSLAGYCLSHAPASIENGIAAVDGNICRCTGYKSIERAVGRITGIMKQRTNEEPASFVANKKILPSYFSEVKTKLITLGSNGGPGALSKLQQNIFVGGGTDLYVQKPEEILESQPSFLFDQPGSKKIYQQDDRCVIGGSATVTDLKNSEIIQKAFPNFQRYAKLISSTPIRNMATIAGNFINASPIGDFTIFFLALDANIRLSGKAKENGGNREILLRKLYKGYKTLDKTPDEVVEQISFRLPGKKTKFNFEKVSKRTNLDIASVNSAIRLEMDEDRIIDASVSAGGVGPIPLYLIKTSEFLKEKIISEELVQEVIQIAWAEISPISDARGSAEYKRLLLGQLIKAHFLGLFPEMNIEKILAV